MRAQNLGESQFSDSSLLYLQQGFWMSSRNDWAEKRLCSSWRWGAAALSQPKFGFQHPFRSPSFLTMTSSWLFACVPAQTCLCPRAITSVCIIPKRESGEIKGSDVKFRPRCCGVGGMPAAACAGCQGRGVSVWFARVRASFGLC